MSGLPTISEKTNSPHFELNWLQRNNLSGQSASLGSPARGSGLPSAISSNGCIIASMAFLIRKLRLDSEWRAYARLKWTAMTIHNLILHILSTLLVTEKESPLLLIGSFRLVSSLSPLQAPIAERLFAPDWRIS